MKQIMRSFSLTGLVLALGACGVAQDMKSVVSTLGDRRGDDKILSTNAPLAVPPGYGLRPPTNPTSSRAAGETARRSRTVLKVPGATTPDGRPAPIRGRSSGESELLRKAGSRQQTSSVVRKTLDIEADREKKLERRFVDKVLNYDSKRRGADSADTARDARLEPPVIKRQGEF